MCSVGVVLCVLWGYIWCMLLEGVFICVFCDEVVGYMGVGILREGRLGLLRGGS